MIGPLQRKKHAFTQLLRQEVFMKYIKHEYKSFLFFSRTCAGQIAVNREYHVHRYFEDL